MPLALALAQDLCSHARRDGHGNCPEASAVAGGRAAGELEHDLDTIAKRAGYGSTDALGHAFKNAYGKSPADYRRTGSHAVFHAAIEAQDGAGFPLAVETLASIRCASTVRVRAYMQIDRAMGRLLSSLATQGIIAPDQRMLAIFHDDPDLVPVEKLRSQACTPVADSVVLSPSIEETVVRGGLYAQLRYRGPYADMKNAYRWLLGTWLPQSGHEPASVSSATKDSGGVNDE